MSGTSRTWDHEECPRDDCDGELQQQDKFNVMCLSCEGVWTHCKTETKHYLQTVDFETVAEKPIALADGGTELREEKQENPPNGHEYLDASGCKLGGYENGDFRLRLKRDDGEMLDTSLTPNQLHALSKQIEDIKERSSVVFPDE